MKSRSVALLLIALLTPFPGMAEDPSSAAGTISPVSATASGSQSSSPLMIIDGSGLSEDPDHPGAFCHSANRWADGGSMWCSGGETVGAGGTCWLRFDLGRSARILALHIWNYNEAAGWQKRSVKAFDLLTSDDDRTWSPAGSYPLRCGAGDNHETGEEVRLIHPVAARYLKTVITAHYGRDNLVGIAEIRIRVGDPQPSDHVLNVRTPFVPRYARITYAPRPRGAPLSGAENLVWPGDAGVVDVTKPPYAAAGDGSHDDTAAIQQAFDDHVAEGAIIFLPNGIYRITDTIRWGSRKGPDGKPKVGDAEKLTTLMGQSEQGAILRLDDHAKGFGDPRQPRAVVWTGGDPAQRFGNEIAHLTIDTGAGNQGCSGVAFVANNQGSIHDVTIASGDGQGIQGLNLGAAGENGPLLVRKLTINGFDVGVAAAGPINSMTIENLTLRDQNLVGIRSFGQHLSIRRLVSHNSVPAVETKGALTVLLDS
ncbi:MAG: discoidin domain-containing protein, partial [Planctomycetes bacterium]|nr:discoidin domain-containing protein [Planctomycetota bacterium]